MWLFSPQADGFINASSFLSTTETLLKAMLNSINNLTGKISEQNSCILSELKLLNARFEEMADTRINERDIGE